MKETPTTLADTADNNLAQHRDIEDLITRISAIIAREAGAIWDTRPAAEAVLQLLDSEGRLTTPTASQQPVNHRGIAAAILDVLAWLDAGAPCCPAHGRTTCPDCSLNGSTTCNGCGYYAATGMHWDTCPNRRSRDDPPDR